jgi:Peptidase family M41
VPPSRLTAFHEAGHAVVAHALGRAFTRVSVVADDDTLGRCSFRRPGPWFRPQERVDGATRRRLEERIMISLAGPEAEAVLSGEYDAEAADEDVARAFRDASYATGCEEEAWAYLGWLRLRTLNLMKRDGLWAPIEALAGELLARGELSYRAARRVIETSARPGAPPGGVSRAAPGPDGYRAARRAIS